MAELTVAMTYGEALFGAAKDLNKKEEILEELGALLEVVKNEPEFFEFLNSPSVPPVEKKDVINNVFSGKICEELVRFLSILVDKGRINAFPQIVGVYKDLLNKEEGFSYGRIVSAKALTPDQLAKFESETGKLLNAKVKLENETDTSLIGGVVIYIEGKVIDASVKNRLQSLADSLM